MAETWSDDADGSEVDDIVVWPRGGWTSERILVALREDAVRQGRSPKAREWMRSRPGRPTLTTVVERFGTWNAAILAAGLVPRPSSRPHSHLTDDQIIARLQAEAQRLGRAPTQDEWGKRPDAPSDVAMRKRFGSWAAALEAAGLTPRPPRHNVLDRIAIGRRVRQVREAKGLTRRVLTDSGVASSTIKRVELGDRCPSPETLRKLARALDVDPRWLETGVPESRDDSHPDASTTPIGGDRKESAE